MITVKDIISATHDDIFPLLVWGEEGVVKPYEPKTYDNLEVHRILTEEENNQGLARHLLIFVKNKPFLPLQLVLDPLDLNLCLAIEKRIDIVSIV